MHLLSKRPFRNVHSGALSPGCNLSWVLFQPLYFCPSTILSSLKYNFRRTFSRKNIYRFFSLFLRHASYLRYNHHEYHPLRKWVLLPLFPQMLLLMMILIKLSTTSIRNLLSPLLQIFSMKAKLNEKRSVSTNNSSKKGKFHNSD